MGTMRGPACAAHIFRPRLLHWEKCWPVLMSAGRQFTGKERGAETDLDYFEKRYLFSAQGRFTSPDPVGIITQKFHLRLI
jgi:RHS repeat-associated protein